MDLSGSDLSSDVQDFLNYIKTAESKRHKSSSEDNGNLGTPAQDATPSKISLEVDTKGTKESMNFNADGGDLSNDTTHFFNPFASGNGSRKAHRTTQESNESLKSEQQMFSFPLRAKSEADKALFGDKDGLKKQLEAAVSKEGTSAHDDTEAQCQRSKRKPAWVDEDDEQLWPQNKKQSALYTTTENERYCEFVRKNYQRFMPSVTWDKVDPTKLDDDELLQVVGVTAEASRHTLDHEQLKYKFTKDLNSNEHGEGAINCVNFFSTASVALVAGESGLASVYKVGGRHNEKLHSMHFKDFPIKCVQNDNSNKAIFGSVKKSFVVYNFETGKEIHQVVPPPMTAMQNFRLSPCGKYIAAAGRFGELHLLTRNANEIIHTFKEDQCVTGIGFTHDSQHIICNSRSPTVSIYSLRQRKLVCQFTDEGCINGTVLDVSSGSRLLATGSNEGVVNLYDMRTVYDTDKPQPLKVFLNLKTAITDLKFSPNGEILAMCSGRAPNALKLAHVARRSVFPNFPPSEKPLGDVRVVAFSPNSGYFAMGTRQKAAKMIRLRHYENY